MDSATQFLLGASIAGTTMAGRIGPRALLIGGLVGTLPDLDSFIPMGNSIDAITYHRGFSHSLFVQTLLAPGLAYLIGRTVKSVRDHGRLLLLTVWLCLITHSLLDSLTTYGTQIFWPFNVGPPVAFPSVFIIDPVYSLLLLTGILCVIALRRSRTRGAHFNHVFLTISTLYLCLGATGHMIVKARAEAHPDFTQARIHVQPAPFNLYFWQVLGVTDSHYLSGMTALPGGCPITQLTKVERAHQPPNRYEPPASVNRFKWFTNNFYTYHQSPDGLAITDLRIGYHPFFVFTFEIAQRQGDELVAIEPVYAGAGSISKSRFSTLLDTLADARAACGA